MVDTSKLVSLHQFASSCAPMMSRSVILHNQPFCITRSLFKEVVSGSGRRDNRGSTVYITKVRAVPLHKFWLINRGRKHLIGRCCYGAGRLHMAP